MAGCLFCGVAVLVPDALLAGAWTRAEGDGQIIFTTGRRVAPIGAIASGIADDDINTTQIFVEYGLIEGLTIGAALSAELSTTGLGEGAASVGGFVRKRVWQGNQGVFSVQAGYRHPIEDLISDDFGANNTSSVPEVEMRLLYGHSLWGDWGSAFFSSEVGYDWRGDEEPDEVRVDLTAGYEPWRCCLTIMSLFTTVTLDGEEENALKLAPSFAYSLFPSVARNRKKSNGPVRPATVQFGINYDLLNPNDGLGVQLSIWRRF
ncbi:MAG: hypothetical protein AAF415_17305 [Pseudomonadota bacterium]